MAELKLKAEKRVATGKGGARRTRMAGKVPAVLYGMGAEPVALEVDRRAFVSALKTDAGLNVLLDLEIDGATTLAMARELQRDPVKGTLLHADFLAIDREQQIDVEVPVHVVGHAPGVAEGGALETPQFTLHVRCRPGDVPESIDVDISRMAIGDTMKVADLQTGGRFEITNDLDTTVAHISAPITEAELEALEAEAGIEYEVPAAELEAEEAEEAAEAGEESPEAPPEEE